MALSNTLAGRVGTKRLVTPGRYTWVGFGAAASKDSLLAEVPQQLELMAARLQNGENIYAVLESGSRASGQFGKTLGRVSLRLQLGESLDAALEAMAREGSSVFVAEVSNKLRAGISKGTPMSKQLLLMADSARTQFRVQQLKAAGRNELRMLIPLVFVILPVTVAFAVLPSLGLIQMGF